MKNSIGKVITLSALVCFLNSSSASALTLTSNPINVAAEVPSNLTLDVSVAEETSIDDQNNPVLVPRTSMDHGILKTGFLGHFYGKVFHVFIGTGTLGSPYTVTSTMQPLSANTPGGLVELPRAMLLTPVSAKDENGDPKGTLADVQDAVGSLKTIYTSDSPTGTGVIVELVYTLNDKSTVGTWAPVLASQVPGLYSSTVVYTLTTT